MNAKKILFPTDFSHLSDVALHQATVLAKEANALLMILHVEEPPVVYGEGAMYYGVPEPDQAALQKMLENVKPTLDGVRFEHRMIYGDPATEIVNMAKEEQADMIVMGTHGRSGLMRLLMGSVAEAVVRKAHCPVMSIKTPAQEPAHSS